MEDGEGALLSVWRPFLGHPSIMVPQAMLVCFGNEWADIYTELTNSLTRWLQPNPHASDYWWLKKKKKKRKKARI